MKASTIPACFLVLSANGLLRTEPHLEEFKNWLWGKVKKGYLLFLFPIYKCSKNKVLTEKGLKDLVKIVQEEDLLIIPRTEFEMIEHDETLVKVRFHPAKFPTPFQRLSMKNGTLHLVPST